MSRDAIPSWCFAVVVVRRGERFLLVQERKPGEPWYLPAGRVEPGESFAEAAVRETLEEAGVAVRLTGILRVEHTPSPEYARFRVVFLAEPEGAGPPKAAPDDESLGAAWVSLAELDHYALRGPEVAHLLRWVAAGAPVYPLELLRAEWVPYGPPPVPG